MNITIRLPADTIDPDDPGLLREIEEAVLYSLVGSGRIDLDSAGNALGLDRDAARQWYEGYRSSPDHDGPGRRHDLGDPLPDLPPSLAEAFADAARLKAERDAERDRLAGRPRHIMLSDLTQHELDRMDRFLKIPPARHGSGLTAVSINHDHYLDDDLASPRLVAFDELTPEEFDGMERYLEATPAEKGSGHADISINHDRYMDDDDA